MGSGPELVGEVDLGCSGKCRGSAGRELSINKTGLRSLSRFGRERWTEVSGGGG